MKNMHKVQEILLLNSSIHRSGGKPKNRKWVKLEMSISLRRAQCCTMGSWESDSPLL